jgi:hypothetical protein
MGGQEFRGAGSENQLAVAGLKKKFEKTPSNTLSKVGKACGLMAACFFQYCRPPR